MPFALLIVGAVLLVAGVRDQQDKLYSLIKGDFTGQDNFAYWLVSILIIGAIGYIPTMEKISRLFMILVLVVLFIHKRGFFDQFNKQIFAPINGVGKSATGLFGGIL